MKFRALTLLLLCLLACSGRAPERLVLALVPPQSAEGDTTRLAMEGLSALLLSRLRAVSQLKVSIDVAGCDAETLPTHGLIIDLQRTERSQLIAAQLLGCDGSSARVEQWVQPIQSQRDWSSDVAHWVAGQLQVPVPQWPKDSELSDAQMQEFLVAVAQIKQRQADTLGQALDRLRQLTAQRPDFLQGQAQLAIALLLGYEFDLLPLDQALEESAAAIQRALAGDPDLALALAAEGLRQMNLGDYQRAATPLARAVALEPGNASALLWLGNALLYDARPKDAAAVLQRARELDPELVSVRISLAEAACLSQAESACLAFLAQTDATPMEGFMRSLLLAHRGEPRQALAHLEQLPAAFNQEWRDELRADLCALLALIDCQTQSLQRLRQTAVEAPRWFEPMPEQGPERMPRIDVWRIDLGLTAFFPQALHSAPLAAQLSEEFERAKLGGLDTPLLSAAQACLQAAADGKRLLMSKDSQWRPMLQRWGCVAG